MKHITSTVLAAGAQENCANSEGHSLPGMGSIIRQPSFRPVSRRDVMAAVNTCGRELGLRQGTVVVLDALLSCLPCQAADGRDAAVTPTTLLTVYASNDTLCFRAKGLTDRQLRRHLETLEKAGLILRRDSANGKRYPVMKDGKAIGAFGLDLSPLFAQADDLIARARAVREQADELRGLRSQILGLRAACLHLRLDEATAAFLEGLRNLLRRTSLTLIEARAALARLTAVISEHSDHTVNVPQVLAKPTTIAPEASVSPSETLPTEADLPLPMAAPAQTEAEDLTLVSQTKADEMPGSDGQYVRHIKPESDTKKDTRRTEPLPRWLDLREISSFYEEPSCPRETAVIAFEFGKMLRISQGLLASAASKLGLWQLLRIEDRIAQKAETMVNPSAYLRAILQACPEPSPS